MTFSWSTAERPIVIAHRGAPALGMENSAAGFAAAITAGADAIETDVRLTRDGHLVCCHDGDLVRLTGSWMRIDEMTLPHLRDALPTVMTLQEAVEASGQAGLLLDLKIRSESFATPLCDFLITLRDRPRVLAGARSIALARAIKRRLPDQRLLAFADSPDTASEWRDAGADWFRLWESDLDSERLDNTKALGLRVAAMVGDWRPAEARRNVHRSVGVIDPAALKILLALAPDAILLDDPRLLRDARS